MSTTTTTITTTTTSSPQTIAQNDDGLPEQQSCFLKFLQLLVIIILIISAMIYFNPSRINAQYVEFQPLPSVNISYGLDYAETIFRSRRSLKGPESIAIHPSNGFLYSGTQDGKIVRANLQKPYSSSPETLGVMGNPNAALPLPCGTYTTEPICGRPLGMEFNRLRDDEKGDDVLFLVDAYLGVAMHNPRTHSLSILVGTSFQTTDGTKINEPVTFNDVAYDGVANKLYFTLSSTRFRLNDLFFDLMEMGQSGMVCAYDMNTKQIDIVAKDIAFANGIVFDPKKQVIYVSELNRARILRINVDWAQKGKRSGKFGQREIFAQNLPILPDNLSFIGDDELWAAGVEFRVASAKNADVIDSSQFPGFFGFSLLDFLAKYPKLRTIIAKAVPAQFSSFFAAGNPGGIVRINAHTGEVIELIVASKTHKNSKLEGVGLSIASITPHASPELPKDQIHIYMGGFTPQVSSFGRLTWDLKAKKPVHSTHHLSREQLRNQYRQQQQELEKADHARDEL